MNPELVLEASRIKPNPAKGKVLDHTKLRYITRGTPMDRGLDVSHAQSPTSSSLLTMLGSGTYKFQIVKATEGQRLRISQYPAHRANGAKYGLRHGAYHFAWCSQDPIVEANNFCTYAALKPGEIACLDLENWGGKAADGTWPYMVGIGWPQRIDYALRWLRECRRLTGATAVIYMNWDWIKNFRSYATIDQWNELCTYPLWLADYDSNAPGVYPQVNPKVVGGSTLTTWLHQWTASKPLNDGGLDGDACMDPSLWNTYAVPQEDIMTDAQYADVTKRLDALTAALTKLTNMVEQKANIVDVKANTEAISGLQTQLAVVESSVASGTAAVMAEQAKLPPQLADMAMRLQGDLHAIGEDLDTSVADAVKTNLAGFSVHTTMQFPTG